MSSEASSHVSFHHLFVNGALFVLTLHQASRASIYEAPRDQQLGVFYPLSGRLQWSLLSFPDGQIMRTYLA